MTLEFKIYIENTVDLNLTYWKPCLFLGAAAMTTAISRQPMRAVSWSCDPASAVWMERKSSIILGYTSLVTYRLHIHVVLDFTRC